jgi:hypothetical protein
MPLEATGERGGLLDSTGRQILNLAEYRIIGLLIAAILLVFFYGGAVSLMHGLALKIASTSAQMS